MFGLFSERCGFRKRRTPFRLTWVAVSVLLSALLGVAHAAPIDYSLSFETSGQSIWGSGEATQLTQNTFLGASWQNKTSGIDAIVGNANTSIPNPARGLYETAFLGCRALGVSSSGCINGQSARSLVIGLGSRPSVRSCGRYAVGCNIARAAEATARAAYDTAFNACRRNHSSSVCRNGQSPRLAFAGLGTAPPATLDLDTRTGVAASATSDGRIGLELGVEVDSGSVDATVSYEVSLDIPDTALLDRSNPINFNANSTFGSENVLSTQFPGLELNLDAVMELSGSVTGEACLIGPGCTSGGTSFNIDERASIASFSSNGNGEVLLLGQPPSFYGVSGADGFPLEVDAAGLATATFHLPQPDASGGLDASTGTLKASGSDDLVDLILDLDNIVATSAGVPGLFGSSADLGPLSLGFDIINVGMGPTIDLVQDFELDPTLFVSFLFDEAVEVGGNVVTELVSQWDALPDITFLSDTTTVSPTFFLQADLHNATSLDFDLEFLVDLLQVNYSAPLFGSGSFGIGNVLDQGVDLFASPAFFDSIFSLGGFNLQVADSFVVDFVNGVSGPASRLARSAVNQIIDAPVAQVSAPGSTALLLLGITGLLIVTRSGRGGRARARATRSV